MNPQLRENPVLEADGQPILLPPQNRAAGAGEADAVETSEEDTRTSTAEAQVERPKTEENKGFLNAATDVLLNEAQAASEASAASASGEAQSGGVVSKVLTALAATQAAAASATQAASAADKQGSSEPSRP